MTEAELNKIATAAEEGSISVNVALQVVLGELLSLKAKIRLIEFPCPACLAEAGERHSGECWLFEACK